MAIVYPELPRYHNVSTTDIDKLYTELTNYASQLKTLLELRDRELNATPANKFYTVTNLSAIGRPIIGDVAYDSSAGQFNGYVNTSVTWVPFNSGNSKSLGYYGSFYDTGNHTLTTTTDSYPVSINSTLEGFGVSVNTGSHIQVGHAGVYNLQFSAQLNNTDTAIQDATIWLRKNGTDIADSAGLIAVPSSHGGFAGHIIVSWNYVLSLSAGDYLEVWWGAEDKLVTIQTIAAGTTPTTPRSPSIIVTLTQV